MNVVLSLIANVETSASIRGFSPHFLKMYHHSSNRIFLSWSCMAEQILSLNQSQQLSLTTQVHILWLFYEVSWTFALDLPAHPLLRFVECGEIGEKLSMSCSSYFNSSIRCLNTVVLTVSFYARITKQSPPLTLITTVCSSITVSQNVALGETFKLFYHETTLHKEHSEIIIALDKVDNILLNEIGMHNNSLLYQIITARSFVETISTEVVWAKNSIEYNLNMQFCLYIVVCIHILESRNFERKN